MKASIRLSPEKTIAPIDDRLYSSFIEHMGRAVYTGIFEPEHPTADEAGLRQDVLELIKPLNISHIRYPGGNFLSGYRWEDGIGPKDERPVRPELAWQALEPNLFGTDEFMDFCEKAGCSPMIGVNLGTGTPQSAADLVEYCNFPGGTHYSELRRKNGHDKPYGVKLWCLGNEMDGPWQICAKPAEEYAAIARESGKMMKLIDPSIELVACGSSYRAMPTFGTWERTVLDGCWEQIDYLSLHQYYQCNDGDLPTFLARSVEMEGFIHEVADICREIKEKKSSDKDVYLSFDEWNVWYHWQLEKKDSPLWTVGRRVEEEEYNFADALVVGCMMNTLINNADTVKIACLAQLVNALAAIMTEPLGPAWAQSIYYPFAYASRYGRGTALNVETHCESYGCSISEAVPYLDSAAVLSPDGQEMSVFIVNRSLDEAAECELSMPENFRITEHVAMAGFEPYAVNSAENAAIKPAAYPLPEDGRAVTLPAFSWNMIRCKMS